MNESDLNDLFAKSRSQETWPQAPDVPERIWRRARTAELLDEEIRRRRERQRPLALGRRVAGIAALLAGEALLLGVVAEFPEQALEAVGLTSTTAAFLALAALPAIALAGYLRREAVAASFSFRR